MICNTLVVSNQKYFLQIENNETTLFEFQKVKFE